MREMLNTGKNPNASYGRAFCHVTGRTFRFLLWTTPKYLMWSSPFANIQVGKVKLRSTFVAAALIVAGGKATFDHWRDFVVYSRGDRVGIIYKLSYKGFPLSSWEGQLSLPGIGSNSGGNISNVFAFSVLDCKIRDQIAWAKDKQITVDLGYLQTMKHWSWNRETDYVIYRVLDPATGKPLEPDATTGFRRKGLQERLVGCSLSIFDHM